MNIISKLSWTPAASVTDPSWSAVYSLKTSALNCVSKQRLLQTIIRMSPASLVVPVPSVGKGGRRATSKVPTDSIKHWKLVLHRNNNETLYLLQITAFMTMCIVSATFTSVLLLLGVAGAVVASQGDGYSSCVESGRGSSYGFSYYYPYHYLPPCLTVSMLHTWKG